jgi:hypothetical protein
MRPNELERRLRARLDALGPAPRAELLHVLMLPDLERTDRIGEFWSYPLIGAVRWLDVAESGKGVPRSTGRSATHVPNVTWHRTLGFAAIGNPARRITTTTPTATTFQASSS